MATADPQPAGDGLAVRAGVAHRAVDRVGVHPAGAAAQPGGAAVRNGAERRRRRTTGSARTTSGRDLWARTWEGTGISLRIGLGTQVIVIAIGIGIGATAAIGGKFMDNALMRFTDLTYAFPDLLAIILLRAVFSERAWPIIGSGDPQLPGLPGPLLQVVLAISLVSWVTVARLVRGQMLSLRESDYVTAARATGASGWRVVFVHMLPNTLGPVIVAATFGIPLAIFAEAVLGYIGFTLPPPTASLGTLVNIGFDYYRVNMWGLLVPSIAIALLMLTFTFIGDGLRDALDPRTRHH
ncbi:MAG: ABC transporter permease [Dehalococcoidia bacterium]|nr:ABC transporter permease [Dehalococcoidia bacterium]